MAKTACAPKAPLPVHLRKVRQQRTRRQRPARASLSMRQLARPPGALSEQHEAGVAERARDAHLAARLGALEEHAAVQRVTHDAARARVAPAAAAAV